MYTFYLYTPINSYYCEVLNFKIIKIETTYVIIILLIINMETSLHIYYGKN